RCTSASAWWTWRLRCRSSSLALAAEAENEGHGNADDLIGDEKEYRRDRHHDEYHGRRDHGFLARRPGDLARFFTHFLQKFERGRCHVSLNLKVQPTINQTLLRSELSSHALPLSLAL